MSQNQLKSDEDTPLLVRRDLWVDALVAFDRASEAVMNDWSAMQQQEPQLAKRIAVLAGYFESDPQMGLDSDRVAEASLVKAHRWAVKLELHRLDYQPNRQLLIEVKSLPVDIDRFSRYQFALDIDLSKPHAHFAKHTIIASRLCRRWLRLWTYCTYADLHVNRENK